MQRDCRNPHPGGMWRCQCGQAHSHYYRFCRACQAPVGQRVRFPSQEGKGQSNGQTHEARQRWAPYLVAHPRCPLMPPPPGRPLMAGAPPVVWRPVGSADMSLASLSPPPPPNVTWNQRFPSNQVTGQQPVIQQQYGCQGCQQIQQGIQYAPNQGNLDG